MAEQQPKKPPRKSKRLKLTITERAKWKQILAEVEKAEAPVSVLRTITVNLIDGTRVEIDVQELLSEGHSAEYIETEINTKLHEMDSIIENVDFFISVDHVAKAVQPFTDSLLKNL
jgi:hypothetical protein